MNQVVDSKSRRKKLEAIHHVRSEVGVVDSKEPWAGGDGQKKFMIQFIQATRASTHTFNLSQFESFCETIGQNFVKLLELRLSRWFPLEWRRYLLRLRTEVDLHILR